MEDVEIRNMTAVGSFGCLIDLKQLYKWLAPLQKKKKIKRKKFNHQAIDRQAIEVNYDEHRFHGLTIRLLFPVKATVLLFRTGKAVCIGVTSFQTLQEVGLRIKYILILHGFQPVFGGFRICNMVSSWSMDGRLNIEKLHTEQGGFYEPEIFPALQFYIGNVTLLIFHSGKVVATGAKRQEELNFAHQKLSNILCSKYYRK